VDTKIRGLYGELDSMSELERSKYGPYYVIAMANEPPAAPATAWIRESLDIIQRQLNFWVYSKEEVESKLQDETLS
jgi:hypothetical protein